MKLRRKRAELDEHSEHGHYSLYRPLVDDERPDPYELGRALALLDYQITHGRTKADRRRAREVQLWLLPM